MSTPEQQIRKLNVQPGDLVALKVDSGLSGDEMRHIADQWRAAMEGRDGRAVILVGGIEVDDQMVERTARALVDLDCKIHAAPPLRADQSLDDIEHPEVYRERARVALTAAFNEERER